MQLLDEQKEIQISNIEDKKSNEVLSKPPQSMKHNIKMDNQQFVKENQKINNFPKNAAAHNLSDYYYYQKIFDFLTKNLEKNI